MRFLKRKIARAQQAEYSSIDQDALSATSGEHDDLQEGDEWIPDVKGDLNKAHDPSKVKKRVRILSTDNIIKNYGRGMTRFALSPIANPYLKKITQKYGVQMKSFLKFVRRKKQSANCIRKIREMLPTQSDSERPDYKNRLVFQEITIIFLKFFCVNWLFNSKIDEKIIHLNYRFKMLRRVRDPENFTYLKEFNFGQ